MSTANFFTLGCSTGIRTQIFCDEDSPLSLRSPAGPVVVSVLPSEVKIVPPGETFRPKVDLVGHGPSAPPVLTRLIVSLAQIQFEH